MPANQVHPEKDQLSAFALGRLESAELEAVENHLASCDTCCDALKQMKEDTFVALVRKAKDASAEATSTEGHGAPLPGVADAATLANDDQRLSTPPVGETTAPGASGILSQEDVPAALANHPRYRIEALLGTGGMGAVYKAEHRIMQRTVALKVINPKFTANKQAAERFRREVRAAGRLQHPNIALAYDADQADDVHFFAMEYVHGTDLQRILEERGPLPVAEACEYIRQAALGLQHAHEHGMVHRDIKPQNLMVTVSGGRKSPVSESLQEMKNQGADAPRSPSATVKILDFGLASLITEVDADDDATNQQSKFEIQKSALTQAGSLMGTPDYMAPEQAKDARSADIRSDIYSLGCTLYALLAGKVPFPGGSAIDKVIAHSERRAKPINEVRKDIPTALVKVLDKMMAKKPEERYQTPAEVATALAPLSQLERGAGGEGRSRRQRLAPTLVIAAGVLLFALGIIFWQTAEGTVRIETTDPEAKVIIDKDTAQITLGDGGTYSLRGGKHGLMIKRGDEEWGTPNPINFQVKRWGESKLKIEFHPDRILVFQDGQAINQGTRTFKVDSEPKIAAAKKAAREWLRLFDAGDFAGTWEQAAAVMQKAASKDEMIKLYDQVAKSTGKLKYRRLQIANFARDMPGGPPGEYVALVFQTLFEGGGGFVEQVNPYFDKDGQWRVAGFVRLASVADPFLKNFDHVLRAARGTLTQEEKNKLLAENHPVMSQLADPPTKSIIEFFAKLPDRAHNELLWDGYLKWKLSDLDAERQKVFRAWYQKIMVDNFKQKNMEVPPVLSAEAFEKADVGAAVIDIPESKEKVVSVYYLMPEHPQPTWVTVVGADASGKHEQGYFKAHNKQLPALRDKPYSKSLAELSGAPQDDGWTPLFNGKDLTGWKTSPRRPKQLDGWKVDKDGILVGSGPYVSHLFTERGDFEDFHLRAEVKINEQGNSGIYFRSSFDLPLLGSFPDGYEAQILNGLQIVPSNKKPEEYLTGSIFNHAKYTKRLVLPDEWFILEVIAKDNHFTIKVNGQTTVEYTDDKRAYRKGHIALQLLSYTGAIPQPTVVHFKKIEIQEFKTSTSAATSPWDEDLLQGTWKSVDLMPLHTHLSIQGNRFVLKRVPKGPDPRPEQMEILADGVFELHKAAEPRQFKVVDPKSDATVLIGIYRLQGDSLSLCYKRSQGNYPTSFTTNPQAQETFVLLKRAKTEVGKEASWTPLFNGTDLAGWKTIGGTPATWRADNGFVRAAGGTGYLVSDKSYHEFQLRAEVRISPGASWRLLFGSDPSELKQMNKTPHAHGLELLYKGQTNDVEGHMRMAVTPTRDGKPLANLTVNLKPNDWFPIEATVRGDAIDVVVAGGSVGASKFEQPIPAGPIVIQLMDASSVLEIRKLEIKELPAPAQAKDEELLQGVWQVISMEEGGDRVEADKLKETIRKMTFTFQEKQAQFTVLWDPRVPDAARQQLKDGEGRLVLDTAKNPKTIEITTAKQGGGHGFLRGIYRLDGDRMEVCFYSDDGLDFPSGFATKRGDRARLMILKRETSPAAQAKSDTELIQGAWISTTIEMGAKQMSESFVKNSGLTITFQGKTAVSKPHRASVFFPLDVVGTFQLDPAQSPKSIDIVDINGSRTIPGIYILQGDTLKLGFAVDSARVGARPSEFTTQQGNALTVFTMKRVPN